MKSKMLADTALSDMHIRAVGRSRAIRHAQIAYRTKLAAYLRSLGLTIRVTSSGVYVVNNDEK